MSSVKVPGKIIQAGYDWTMRLIVGESTSLFPAGSEFRAQARRAPEVEDVLYTLTTANGAITRVNGNTLDLLIPGSASEGWPSRDVYIDIVRTDGVTTHLGFRLKVPVQQPITR